MKLLVEHGTSSFSWVRLPDVLHRNSGTPLAVAAAQLGAAVGAGVAVYDRKQQEY